MKRKIVHIDQAKCNGCGDCVNACHEGAIQLVNGKAQLVSDVYCDGLGDCLGTCPTDAIRIEEREADAFDPAAVESRQRELQGASASGGGCSSGGCPGMRVMELFGSGAGAGGRRAPAVPAADTASDGGNVRLGHWPVQLRLVPVEAPWWDDADVLLAADCVPVAYPGFRSKLLSGRSLAIACPKLDDTSSYVEKLTEILRRNRIRSLTVARMSVPCCSGIARMAEAACERAGWDGPLDVVTVDVDGSLLNG
jgi:NAD-dependent dihydropyrimidine dehydrogenase PreA subunit